MKETVCREIYREAFHDPDNTFEDLLFNNCSRYIAEISENEIPVSMLFALPCLLKLGKAEREAVYIYAAATAQSHRGIGYMGKLIEKVKKANRLIFLRPAEKSLVDYYARFGFKTVTAKANGGETAIIPAGGYKSLTDCIGADNSGEEFTLMYYSEKEEFVDLIGFPFSMID